MIIPTTLQIKPEVANPLPLWFFSTISFVAFLATTTPKPPKKTDKWYQDPNNDNFQRNYRITVCLSIFNHLDFPLYNPLV